MSTGENPFLDKFEEAKRNSGEQEPGLDITKKRALAVERRKRLRAELSSQYDSIVSEMKSNLKKKISYIPLVDIILDCFDGKKSAYNIHKRISDYRSSLQVEKLEERIKQSQEKLVSEQKKRITRTWQATVAGVFLLSALGISGIYSMYKNKEAEATKVELDLQKKVSQKELEKSTSLLELVNNFNGYITSYEDIKQFRRMYGKSLISKNNGGLELQNNFDSQPISRDEIILNLRKRLDPDKIKVMSNESLESSLSEIADTIYRDGLSIDLLSPLPQIFNWELGEVSLFSESTGKRELNLNYYIDCFLKLEYSNLLEKHTQNRKKLSSNLKELNLDRIKLEIDSSHQKNKIEDNETKSISQGGSSRDLIKLIKLHMSRLDYTEGLLDKIVSKSKLERNLSREELIETLTPKSAYDCSLKKESFEQYLGGRLDFLRFPYPEHTYTEKIWYDCWLMDYRDLSPVKKKEFIYSTLIIEPVSNPNSKLNYIPKYFKDWVLKNLNYKE
jgi:hypothetical protein